MKSKRTFGYLALLSIAIALVACGGGNKKNTAVLSSMPASSVAVSSYGTSNTAASSLVTVEIRLNQLGFQADAEKLAVVPAADVTRFTIVSVGTETVVFTGNLSAASTWSPALELVKLADFSALTTATNFKLRLAGLTNPASFKISSTAYDALNAAAIRAFYDNRASTPLLETLVGVYLRAAGHSDNHSLAATNARPAGALISAPKGWYDAGDYNKYIINSGISTYMLMAAYESLPDYFNS